MRTEPPLDKLPLSRYDWATRFDRESDSHDTQAEGHAMLKAIVFDLDETLIGSKEAILDYHRKLFAHLKIDFPEDKQELFYTAPMKGFLERLIPDPQKLAEAKRFADEWDATEHIRLITLKPYVTETIEALHGRFKLAVATNRGWTTPKVLERFKLDGYFEIVLHAFSLENCKPHPQVMQTIFDTLGVTKDETLLVGDSYVDVETAANIGCRSVIVGDRATPDMGDEQIADLSQLIPLIDRLERNPV